jgi:inner membrane protein
MDNLCHALAGLAIGEAGLKKKTALASATLMIGANLPDVDGLLYFIQADAAIGFRRGWTHGILAMAVWPFVLAGLMMLVGRLFRKQTDPRGLLLLSAVSVWSHPLLDLMNTYGVRLLMPFSGRWFYGDTLFIIDPWVWIALTLGIVLARLAQRRGSPAPYRPMRVVLALTLAYVATMASIGFAGRGVVRREARARSLEPARIMVAPVALHPLRREFVVSDGSVHVDGFLELGTGGFTFVSGGQYRLNADAPGAREAAATPQGRRFLDWARFPFFVAGPADDCPGGHVCINDARYYPGSWARVAIPVGGTLSSSASTRFPEQP